MAVTAVKPPPAPRPPDRDLERLDVIAVRRDYLQTHPDQPRRWSVLMAACLDDPRCTWRRVQRGDRSCSFAWTYPADHLQAPPNDVAWFREGPHDLALLYQQAWRADDVAVAATAGREDGI